MANRQMTPFWHKESFKRFMQEHLPQLLAARLPLAGYQYEPTGDYTCRVAITLATRPGEQELEVEYTELPQPDDEGVFLINGRRRVVVPTAAHSELDVAQINCVGEMLYDLVIERLGQAPPDLPWDAALVRAWLPLDRWIGEFMHTSRYAQELDETNQLSYHTHLRRLIVLNQTALTTPSQFGRVCPLEMPEGPNLGHIFTIALGAAIRDGRLVIDDERPEAGLGLSASLIPCLEHDDPNRLLMGANMQRQWLPYAEPEPALVQSGNEPAAPHFWCGRNLLTAFVPWGGDTFEDGIILSESAARRLSNVDHQVEPGDKLSNRHGSKGVVSRILPDAQMPRLPDGAPVELIFSGILLPGRLNIGQLWEAVLGRLARTEGNPIIAPPFHGPSEQEIRQRLAAAGLPEDGMETLVRGDTGESLAGASTVGWVYWGRTAHLARDKMRAAVDEAAPVQRQGEMEAQVLRQIGAFETIREHFNTRAAGRSKVGAETRSLAERVAAGKVEQAGPPAPGFALLQRRLAAAGINLELEGGRLHFRLAQPGDNALILARPLSHPWLGEHELTAVAPFPAMSTPDWLWPQWSTEPLVAPDGQSTPLPAYTALAEANNRLARLLHSNAPPALIEQATATLETRLHAYCVALLTPADLFFDSHVLFSARAVLAPGPDLAFDQIGLGEEMAWALFGPLVTHELGDAEAVRQRTPQANEQLDALMARAWVIVNCPPSIAPTAMLAFHPVREASRVIRLHPLTCRLLDADFDGDQAALFLPITDAGQQEAETHLSVASHLTRDPRLLEEVVPSREAMWGLAYLSRGEQGRKEIEEIVGGWIDHSIGFVTRVTLSEALQRTLARQGPAETLARVTQLWRRGFEVAQGSGVSLSAFTGAAWQPPPLPATDDPALLRAYAEQAAEQILACPEEQCDFAPYVLGIKSGAIPLGHLRALMHVLGIPRVVQDVYGKPTLVRQGFREGLSLADFQAVIPGARAGLACIAQQWEAAGQPLLSRTAAKSFHVLARARRAEQPGVAFARAAASGEIDPLVDVESRLFVGLPV